MCSTLFEWFDQSTFLSFCILDVFQKFVKALGVWRTNGNFNCYLSFKTFKTWSTFFKPPYFQLRSQLCLLNTLVPTTTHTQGTYVILVVCCGRYEIVVSLGGIDGKFKYVEKFFISWLTGMVDPKNDLMAFNGYFGRILTLEWQRTEGCASQRGALGSGVVLGNWVGG